MSKLVKWLDKRLYPGVENNWDDKLLRESILQNVDPRTKLLDLGAGAGIVKEMNFRGIVSKVCGVDPDARVLNNPYLDEAKIGTGESIPYEDESFDVVVADNVLEHLDNPIKVFDEVRRVLKPGGLFIAKTPNRFHYMPVIASITPHQFHRWFNKLRNRSAIDTYPTKYKANTLGDIWKLSASCGMSVVSISVIESRPEYLRFSGLSYLIGWIYERLVNRIGFLRQFGILIICTLRRT